jgi:VanZ family protein
MVAIFIVSAQPEAPLPSGVGDKQGHISAYTGLAVLTVRALAGRLPTPVTVGTAVSTLAITIGYGVGDELHQSFVPGRMADPEDVYADAIGALLGLGGCWAWGIIAARVND